MISGAALSGELSSGEFLTAYTEASTAINCMKKSDPATENTPAAIFRTTGTIAYILFVQLPDQ